VTTDGPPAEHRVVVIGAGFSGIAMGVKLLAAGIEDFVILEKSEDLGGTWRDNTYPGCACDIPSHLYSYSFRPNPRWSRMFSGQPEIWAYLRDCVEAYGLTRHLRYGVEVVAATYDDRTAPWTLTTAAGDSVRAGVVVAGVGALHEPRYPRLPGLASFRGTTFHSARWNHEHDLRGERVAVIGTGASAVQFIPHVAERAARLDVYQRSAPWVIPRPDRPIGQREQRWHARVPLTQRVLRHAIFWALELRGLGFTVHPRLMRRMEAAARRHLDRQVDDTGLRARLTPDYPMGCKRVLVSDDYYPTLTRADVELVPDRIREVTPDGLVTVDGTMRPADTIVFGTGFRVSAGLTGMTIRGRDGKELSEHWRRVGASAHLGITVPGFPNLFLLTGPNTGLGHNSLVFMIEQQVNYVVRALAVMRGRGADWMTVREGPQRRFVDRVQARLADSVWSGCRSWYLDESGRNFAIWPYFTWQYWLKTRRVRVRDFDFGVTPWES
jgi:cation diffusion facilitator CzcD-associated flavoprotein CzcO